ncbi:MAG: DUF4175 family protein [Paracoccaceae bacterium]|nr:DUF4175 family protein [Paracoccaceae bacterium]
MLHRPRPQPATPLDALARPIALTRAGMVLERGLRAFWPTLSILALCSAALSFGLADAVSGIWLQGLGFGAMLVLLGSLILGLRWFRWPARAEAMARLDATLPGRPLTALSDQMALGGQDPAAQALWAAHLQRMAARAAGARAVAPTPDLARRDPFALRLSALTALVLALLFGAPTRLLDPGATLGGAGPAEAAMGPSWEGWAEPPRYTGKPGIYLNNLTSDDISVPEGTRMAFRFYGAAGAIAFEETVSSPAALPQAEGAGDVARRDFDAVRSGVIDIRGPAGRRFAVNILPDDAPSVELVGLAERRADGKLSQPFHATDDYAVTAGRARITLDLAAVPRRYGLALPPEPRDDLVFDLPLPISGNRADFTEALAEDAAKHPWANLPVSLALEVEDGRGQVGSTGVQSLDLPGRRFFDPLAASLIEARRDLLWSRDNGPRVAQWLRAVVNRPEGFVTRPGMAGLITLISRRIEAAPLTPALRDELAEDLWQLAEMLEDGGLVNALAAMQQAQQRLSEAIRNGASKDEIAKLMAELKEATDRYIQMLAERAEAQDQGPQFGQKQQSQQITGDQIQQMMDEIQKLMEEGRMAEAQELLDQLARMMENLQVQQGQGGQGDTPGGQAMKDLADTLREQQKLSDDAFRDMQEGPTPGDPGQPQGQGQAQEPQDGGQSLADRQRALRKELGRQQGLMPRLGNEAGDAARQRLDDAGRAMDEAEQALRDGDTGRAIDQQADAIEALREGMRNLGEAFAREQGRQQGQPGQEGAQQQGQAGGRGTRELPRDPLGRNLGDGGRLGATENMLQGEDIYRRARDLLNEIRRRSAERLRPEPELDYLRRLLDQF